MRHRVIQPDRRPLRVLIVEDNEYDAEIVVRQLKQAGFDPSWVRVDSEPSYLKALDPDLDVILADFNMPTFSAPRALELLRSRGIGVPLIVVSGSIGEETAVKVLQAGASDYLLKDRLARLGDAVRRVIEERQLQRERHALEEQYRQSQKMEAVGQLAGGIAHDFNNLLTAIQGYCELVASGLGTDNPVERELNEIRRAADRAASLTRQLLAFSRRQILEPRVLDLRDSLRGIEPMLRRLIGEDIQVVVHAADEIGRVRADPGQIEQVILNLAVNARDAMPQGGTLRLEVADVELDDTFARNHPATTPGRYVLLAVSDTGIGMDGATRARVFEPFFTTKEKGKGTGLGLSTVYGIVKQSGGNIWLYSEPGAGTTFKIYLPRIDAPAEQPVPPPTVEKLTGTETILVVEDEDSVRDLIDRVLSGYGYRVLVARTPREAVSLAAGEAGPIDLIVTDVVLPQMSGSALANEILGSRPQIRVLYMSGYTDDAIVHRGVLDMGTLFLQKPFTPEVLARKVREVLR
jgi:two-component system cell cycle sensor histidine kinase/response regulator CckA